MSLAALSRARLATRQRHDLVRGHTSIRSASECIQHQASSGALSGLTPSFTDARVVCGQLELDLRIGQQTEPVTDILRDGDLPFARNLHGNTFTEF